MVNGEISRGNGERMPEMDSPSLASHQHCIACFRSGCSAGKNDRSCEMVHCVKCGVRLHGCKAEEHLREICAEATVECINTGNGCGMMMKRKILGIHLEVCPASVIFCSVEWNRWPMHHHVDKPSPVPFFLPNPQGFPDQLDIALASRDQAMLNAAYEAPRQFRRMRNDLTERFPAVPLPAARPVPVAILKERELAASALNGLNGHSNVYLSRDTSVDSDSQSTISDLTSEEEFSWSDTWQKRRNPPGLSRSLCSKLYSGSRQVTDSLKTALQIITESHDISDEERLLEVDSVNGDSRGPSEFGDTCPVGSEKFSNGHVFDDLGLNFENGDIITLTDTEELPVAVNAPPAPPAGAAISLGVNVVVESITRYQTKPKSMLTFVCGQTFRRNEYAAHYKNIHSEIQGGLTWLEQRCPLAQYGCPFSSRRLHPATPPTASIMHSSDLQSFGVRHTDESCHLASLTGESFLSRMPDEIMLRIGKHLDGFALNNFTRVNRRVRFACLPLLETKGMVHQEWNKVGRGRWRIEFQRWLFSTAFEEIHSWKFTSSLINAHMTDCAFFRRVRHVTPIKLPNAAQAWRMVDGEDADMPHDLLERFTQQAKKHMPYGSDEIIELVPSVGQQMVVP